jgi:hypothetical protein
VGIFSVSSIGVIIASILSHSSLIGTSSFISFVVDSVSEELVERLSGDIFSSSCILSLMFCVSLTFRVSGAFASSFLGIEFFNSQIDETHFDSKSFLAASKNLARAEIGDFIEPTNLPSNISFDGREARTFVSTFVFNCQSNMEIDQTNFHKSHLGQLTSFIKTFNFPRPAIASSLEQTTQICQSISAISISIFKASFTAFLIIVFLARV